ncbi:tyrosine-type recombinase/integrase [Enterococcus faecalis]|uniref:tyrosine-type recombinase/integrase n=1 Tax=Enterococcus sp. GC34 TaxID=3231353 RepID=UPI0019FE0A40|nr:site-specific integrase [Enterococcus faecalis]EGS8238849.1 site-specific integrase [Enterococcus faecalis]
MGISKRGTKWRAFISVKKEDGKYRNKPLGSFDTKFEAVKAVEYAQSVASKDRRMAFAVPFYEYFEWFFQKYKKEACSKKTQGHYQHTKKYIKKYLGDTPLSDLTNDKYVELLNQFSKDYSPATLEKFHTHMRACVKQAFALGHIPIEFTSGSSLRGLGDKSKEKPIYQKYIDDTQYKKVLQYVVQHRDKESSIYYVIIFSLLTGCRFSEIVGITIDDLNFEQGFVDINKTYDYMNPPSNLSDWLPCKNKNSYRKVEMPQNLAELLKEFWQYQQEKCQFHQIKNPRKQIFFDWQEGSCDNRKANIEIKKILVTCGITDKPKFSMHCCRHTFVSFLIYQGYSVEEVALIVGDKPEEIRKTYYHVFQEYEVRTRSKTRKLMNSLF